MVRDENRGTIRTTEPYLQRNEADFEEWREDAAWHAAKYARWDHKGERRI